MKGKFGESFSWPVWTEHGAALDTDNYGSEFLLEDPSAAPADLVIGTVLRPRCFGIIPERPNGRAVLVLAGGGYTKLVIGKEGFEVARWLAGLGFHAFVLAHRFPSAAFATGTRGGDHAPVDDAIETMRQIRASALKLRLDPRGIGVLGLSSGGHLAACLVANYPENWTRPDSALADVSYRPDFLIVGYGPISTNAAGRTVIANKPPLLPAEKQALYDTIQPDAHLMDQPPPAFLVYASDDAVVPVENGYRMHAGLRAKGVHAELHIFAHAPHGFALRESNLPVGQWTDLCERWLQQIGMLENTAFADQKT